MGIHRNENDTLRHPVRPGWRVFLTAAWIISIGGRAARAVRRRPDRGRGPPQPRL